MRKLPLRVWLLLLVAAAVVPYCALLAYRIWSDVEASTQEARARVSFAAEQAAQRTELRLAELKSQIIALAQRPKVRALDPRDCDPLFGEANVILPQLANIVTVDREGDVVCTAVPLATTGPRRPSSLSYLEELLRTRTFTVGEPVKGHITKRWVVMLAEPIINGSGEVVGMLGFPIDLLQFWSGSAALHVPFKGRIRIVDDTGTILASSDEPAKWVGEKVRPGFAQRVVEPASGTLVDVDRFGVERIYGTARVPGVPWYVLVDVPTAVVHEHAYRSVWRDAALWLAVALVSLILAYTFARRITRPVEDAAAMLHRWAAGSERAPAAVSGPAEVANLAAVFNQTLDTLDHAKADLRASEEQAAAILRTALDGIALFDLKGRILDVNDAYCMQSGYRREELLGMTIADLQDAEDSQETAAHIERIVATGSDRFETRHRRKDGTSFEAEVSVSFHPGDGGRLVVFQRDVTERKRAERTLREERRRLDDILSGTRAGAWEWNLQSGELVLNERSFEIIGYTAKEFAPLSIEKWRAVVHPDDLARVYAWLEQHGADESAYLDCELRERHKDGHWVWVLTRGQIVRRTEDGKPLLMSGTHLDISAIKEVEAELEQAKAAAEAANRAKSAFLAHMSHEIRTPMNGVIGVAHLLEGENLTADQHALVHTISESGQALLRIINDILDFSKLEAGQLHIEQDPFEPGAVLARVEHLLRPAAEKKGIAFSITLPPGGLHPVVGDALRLEQVLVNLINNAIKFTDRGSVALTVGAPEETADGVRLRFEVQDTGIGIEPEAIDTLFTPFTQASVGITRRFGGTGLGLAICKRLVEMMGGEIGATSAPGEGSMFWFELPLVWDRKPPVLAEPVARRMVGPQLTGLRVLAVDDNRINLLIVEKNLRAEGATVALAADGQQALQLLHANPDAFDVVLMDVQMPVMDGLTATREIRADPNLANLPVVALTAGVLPEERNRALAAGVDDFLTKPLDAKQMVSVLRGIMNNSSRRG